MPHIKKPLDAEVIACRRRRSKEMGKLGKGRLTIIVSSENPGLLIFLRSQPMHVIGRVGVWAIAFIQYRQRSVINNYSHIPRSLFSLEKLSFDSSGSVNNNSLIDSALQDFSV